MQRLLSLAMILLLSPPVLRADAQPIAPTTAPATQVGESTKVPQWDCFDLALSGPMGGSPFDIKLSARFTHEKDSVQVRGFYDGNGVYRVRVMPTTQGSWRYETSSDVPELNGKTGGFMCVQPAPRSHGPVVVRNTFHFAYADGTPYIPLSTTLYGWAQQRSEELKEQTIATLKASPFNRVRMMVLPITWGRDNEPNFYPFEENADQSWNYNRFDPRYFQDLEKRIGQLRDLGIEAELILFHSRDSGLTELDRMPPEVDDRYVRYVVARFSAFRNIWWSLANEFDAISSKRDADWDRIFQIIEAEDPSHHLRSIHQMRRYYDFNKPWVTHMSIQSELGVTGFGRPVVYRQLSRKPVIFDELKYEGDIPDGWGHLSGEEIVFRFWISVIGGTYPTHGETYANALGIRWISRGGKLVGESPARVGFLKDILATAPADGLEPVEPQDETKGIAGRRGAYYLVYFGKSTPTEATLQLPGFDPRNPASMKIDVLDTWNMTVTPAETIRIAPTTAPSTATTRPRAIPAMTIPLPGKPYIAIRVQRAK